MRLSQPTEIRTLLETDRPWSVYALGDLSPGFFEHSEWYAAGPALALLYRAFAVPVLFTLGSPEAVRPVLNEIFPLPQAYLSIRPDILPLVRECHRVEHETPVWRMTLVHADFRPASGNSVARLGPDDLAAVQALFADGDVAGETPDFFSPEMLAHGIFYGVWEGEGLTAAAGTHLVSPQESVGAVGNVYTRRDRRGRGLAARTTSAVTAELLGLGLRTVALNVYQKNSAAVGVYERLGFRKYCAFYEGLAYAAQPQPTVNMRSETG
jgi:GNAT superfamily N-acetyltransferase